MTEGKYSNVRHRGPVYKGLGSMNPFDSLFSAGRFLQSAVASGTSNPQLGGPVIRTFQLPPQASPSSGRWNYWREMAESFADFHVNFGFFYMP
jgi:hypothetical protein